MSDYLELSPEAKAVIEQVKGRFGDLYDAEDGGPHLPDEDTTAFDDNRYALLLEDAIQRINGRGVTLKEFSLSSYPIGDISAKGCLVTSLMMSVIQHFIISYTEVADASGLEGGVYMTRESYQARWKIPFDMLDTELNDRISSLDRGLLRSGTSSLVYTNQMPWGMSARVRPLVPMWYR